MAVTPSHFAAAASNSLSITINVGDLVCVVIGNQDGTTPSGLADDGGNSIGLYENVSNGNADGKAGFYVYLARAAATTVSFTGGHGPAIAVGTFTGANVARFLGNIANGNQTDMHGDVTTIYANSYIICLGVFFKAATAVSVTGYSAGTQGAVATSSSTNDGAAVGYRSSVTPGNYAPAVQANFSTSGVSVSGIDIELALVAGFFGAYPVPLGSVLAGGTTGTAYSETISAQEGVSPYTYAVTSGSLPTSLSLNTSTGVISGTPTVAGTYTFTITVTDTNGNTGSQSFNITIAAPVAGGGAFTFLS